jgi:asparagine synthase (glutamine-hydrolysing)
VTKVTLKQAFRKQLPRSILDRAKMGFTTPVVELLRGLAPVIEDTLPLDSGIESIVNKKQVMVLWREFLAGRSEHALRIWTVLVLHLWCLQRAQWSAR